jgi:hypothetical protein
MSTFLTGRAVGNITAHAIPVGVIIILPVIVAGPA